MDHLEIDAPQLHPAGDALCVSCLDLVSLSPVRGLHLPDLQLKKPGGKWGQFPVLAGVGGWFMHGGSWLAPCIALRRHRRAYRFVKSCPNFQGHCCKVSDEAAFCLIQRPYISKTLLT
ncbi:hypothetical protein, partial [Escherichia coli]|uniref:hypothetical protein n=1 Tax=Escherichia coli TaxID=562 RepID=UPI001F4A0492